VHEGSLLFKEYENTAASGAIVWADSIEELATAIAVPVDKLTAELDNAHAVHDGKGQDRFGRKAFEKRLQAPFGAIKVRPALFHTQGGVQVNADAQVLREDGSVIKGLYAAGGAAVGISGHGSDGYLAGNGLLPAFGFAYLAAKSVASA
jgi:fumarate reductase flavoprotein subunit